MSQDKSNETAASTTTPQKSLRWGWLLSWRGVLAIVGLGLLVQMGFLCWFVMQQPVEVAEEERPPAEVTLGSFQFVDLRSAQPRTPVAQFQLHIDLLEDAETKGRAQLTRKRFKVQQGIEELLRQLRFDEFEDPLLVELKRRIQESVNRSLGMRVVDEVLITDLRFLPENSPDEPHETPERGQGTEDVAAHPTG
jgi:flagellar basal body-associated protein FliL